MEDESGVYEGDINHGVKNGRGVMKFRNGDIYTGYWKGNMMEGDGTMVYSVRRPRFPASTRALYRPAFR